MLRVPHLSLTIFFLTFLRATLHAYSGSPVVRLPVREGLDLRFTHIQYEEADSPRNIRHIVRDNLGFLWFGTQDGLKRFDGYRFRDYRYQGAGTGSLSGTSISALFKDQSGKIWVASDQFLDRYDPITETFQAFRCDPRDTRLFSGEINQINQDSAGILWLATTRGLVRLDPTTSQSRLYRHREEEPASLSGDQVKSTFEEADGTFWVASTDGLDVLDRLTGRVQRRIALHFQGNKAESGLPIRIFADRAGVLWMTSAFGPGLAIVDRSAGTLIVYTFLGAREAEASDSVEAIHEDDEGNLWLATSGNGLLKLDRDRKAFARYRNQPGIADSLTSNRVLSLYEDPEHNLWVGTQGGVINRVSVVPAPFTRYRHEPGNPNSLENDEVTSVYEDSQATLWVGNRTALNRINRKTRHFTAYPTAGGTGNLSNTYVLSIVEDRFGYLWFGTNGGGLNRFDRRTGRFKVYRHTPADSRTLSDDVVYCLFVDSKGDLWAGTSDGLNRYDAKTEHFERFKSDGVGTSSYRTIAQDASGNLWLSTVVAGVHRFNVATGIFTIYRRSAKAGSLSNDWVNAVTVDHAGTVWAGTLSGLNRLDPATGVFQVYYERDGLPNANVASIVEDAQGDLWLGTSKGLSRFNPRTKRFSNYYASDGIAGNELYRRNGGFRSPSGEVFFCSTAGLTSFFPQRIIDNPYIPPVVLTDFMLADKSAGIGGGSPLSRSISVTQALTLNPWQNIFSFEFSALSYASPDRNRYRYRLDGLETAWNERDGRHRTVTYTTLPPGTYTFRVQGSNNRGAWNEAGVSLRVRILPPWWKTSLFGMLCAISCVLAIWYAHQFRLAQIARQLSLRFEERLAERTRIAQDLHDTLLQGIVGASMHLHVAAEELPAESSVRQKLTRVMEIIGSVLDDGRKAVYGLRFNQGDCEELDQAFLHLARELTIRDTVGFDVTVDGLPRPLHPVVRDEVYRIGREAVINAFRHSRAKNIGVELEYAKDQFRLLVRDDGCGIDPDVMRSGRKGHWGLHGMRERAEGMDARFTIRPRVGGGTEIELCIPFRTAFRPPAHDLATQWFGWQPRGPRRATREQSSIPVSFNGETRDSPNEHGRYQN